MLALAAGPRLGRQIGRLLLFAALLPLFAGGRVPATIEVPDFALPQVGGGVFHLRGYSGPVLLAFLHLVPDSVDTPSRRQIAFLLSMQHQYASRGLQVAIVDSSTLVTGKPVEKNALINARYDLQLDVPLLEDADLRVVRRLAVTRAPTLILLTRDRRIAQRWDGLTGPAILAQAIQQLGSASLHHAGMAP